MDISVTNPAEWLPTDVSDVISWQGHIPFAFSLMQIVKPACFVELGSHKGDSYFAFCDAVKRFNLPAKCYAVDTWQGDEHAGLYGNEIFEQVAEKNSRRYSEFSTLLRCTFDEALAQFQEKSIDILHIDGLHTYEAVKHDFETWRNKLSDKGIVLFHDTCVHEPDFGVWKFWEEISKNHPHFEFRHSNGLGVLALGQNAAELISDFFFLAEGKADDLRLLYETLGKSVSFNGLLKFAEVEIRRLNNTVEQERKAAKKEIQRLNEFVLQERESAKNEFARLNTIIQEQNNTIREYQKQINQIVSSTSWKLTFPLRWFSRKFNTIASKLKSLLLRLLRKTYHLLPISVITKNRLRNWFYTHFSFFFSQTLSYKLWQSQLLEKKHTTVRLDEPPISGEPFNFFEHQSPLVSIIIPVYGKYAYTYRCLKSLRCHSSGYSFEVIVINDCSTDETSRELPKFGGLRFENNSENLGFIRSCNKGAQLALGKLLVFLNNDTVIRAGWLDELVNTFNIIPGAGLAGSKLIYPDGRLQEAGGIIWRDGSGWNYGRLGDPNQPEYNYLREADYCSGASVMVPKELFDKLDGFDEYFAPAYGEDSDLAFRVRQAGYKVLYQPLSQLIHYEGITSGKDTGAGIKAHQVENAKKLYARWQGVLANHGAPGIDPELEKDRPATGRVLVLDHCTPTPDQDAGSVTVVNIMRIMQSLGFKVSFIPEDNFLFIDPYTSDLQRIGIECFYAPYAVSVEQHLKQYGQFYDAVIFFRVTVAERNLVAVQKYCPNAKLLFHTSDLHHLREMREAELKKSEHLLAEAKKTKQRELDLIRKVDATIVHSSTEKDLLEQELAGENAAQKIFLFSWAIDIPGAKSGFGKRDGIIFIGGFQHLPNVDAVIYFAKEIFPLIRNKLPNSKFLVVGSRAPQEVRDLAGNGIEVLGFVEDLQPMLDRCRLSVIPLRYGAGIKGKIGTCLSHGLPCVSTSIGIEGMDFQSEEGVLVGDTPEAFAAEAVRLYDNRDLWENLSKAGLQYVIRNYSLESGKQIFKAMLNEIGISQNKIADREIYQNLSHLKSLKSLSYAPDLAEYHLLFTYNAGTKDEAYNYLNSETAAKQREIEHKIITDHGLENSYELPGYCEVCNDEVNFLVDRLCGAIVQEGNWIPNWRERLVCESCGLNSRQRAMTSVVKKIVNDHKDRRVDLYLMEQVTPIYQWLNSRLPKANCTGSEYLGPNLEPGKIIKEIRHEDAENLSFADNSFDLVVSNDVLEHVPNPKKAITEAYRILRPNGKLIMTVPFFLDKHANERRAELKDGNINHILSPVYHGNPVSEQGSLVFTDFGWEFLQNLRNAGFREVELNFYWSEIYGYLGVGQHFILAEKVTA